MQNLLADLQDLSTEALLLLALIDVELASSGATSPVRHVSRVASRRRRLGGRLHRAARVRRQRFGQAA
ncbi:MAG TPA: hypothetical protein VGW38_03600 [Chloroflexota bacterium]|nr:hypothetical protein [Chloroflexota bacterium]